MSAPVRLAIFDCDGTLVDSQANICRAMIEAFAIEKLTPPTDPAIRRVVGLSLTEAMRALLPEAGHDVHVRLGETYKRAFQGMRGRGQVDEPLFPGIAEALRALDAEGWMLGVATGKSDRGLRHCLETHGIEHLFVSLQTADRHPSKPHPSMALQAMADAGATPESSFMIGDTSFDIGMGINAGCTTVGVAWGYHAADELFDEGAHFVADRPDQLPDILRTALAARG
ncbi:HAD hydrolase-like protein [Sphingomonadaceae bacterium G21617-S1]|uniref:HAD hydrolase-like protein n=1 Tax=Rhizorhabdus sp. TaxID=1968843 RepID=UPI00198D4AAD|nr:HAD hydrolase-like protein [Rhizorhabdus sp.]MBD3760662.1 HAD hydrolase-like protein [Rhizorhabdus sp.]MCZ4342518.1 HAD hydrolase-like protein [Sphingomonadaceae bacterium G21617-S1]